MTPVANAGGYGVRAVCPTCEAVSLFDWKESNREIGYTLVDGRHRFNDTLYDRVHYRMLRCSGCGRGGLAKFHDNSPTGHSPVLEAFHPHAQITAPLPETVPDGIASEYREAELCASVGAWRAASAMLRSALEKTLKANGYIKGMLQAKIDAAVADGVITAARGQKAHEDVRVLGNEVVHDEWRAVEEEEVETALHYVQRVLEDLYDDRDSVEKILQTKGRLIAPEKAAP